ncbi:hypothetical protein BDW59DRAFT_164673 [Aspergillus cavernicola]|uniref:Uncharacterized protein n=1 Tax=Aspergillus cavernicola TaxID=176166 RepID=A0ABR4HYD3_9EURO
MPSRNIPAQVLETYMPLSNSFEMAASPIEQHSYSQQLLSSHYHSLRRGNYYKSSTQMWICCKCGDGPKVCEMNASSHRVYDIVYAELD